MLNLLRLIRYPNLIFIILSQYGIQYLIINPVLSQYDVSGSLSNFEFFLLVLSTTLIAAGGYIINDYFDVQIDSINKPEKLFIDKTIKRRHAILLHQIFSGISIIIGIYLAWKVHNFKLLMIQPIAITMLWFYSTNYKKQPFIGNILVSFLTAFVIIIVCIYQTELFYDLNLYTNAAAYSIFITVFFYFVFAFLVSMMREIVKDMQDIEGDEKYHCRTLPIVIGINKSKYIVYFFAVIVFGLVILVQKGPYQVGDYLTVIYLSQTIQLPLVISMWLLFNADEEKHFKKVSLLIKLIMLMGITSMLYFYYLTR